MPTHLLTVDDESIARAPAPARGQHARTMPSRCAHNGAMLFCARAWKLTNATSSSSWCAATCCASATSSRRAGARRRTSSTPGATARGGQIAQLGALLRAGDPRAARRRLRRAVRAGLQGHPARGRDRDGAARGPRPRRRLLLQPQGGQGPRRRRRARRPPAARRRPRADHRGRDHRGHLGPRERADCCARPRASSWSGLVVGVDRMERGQGERSALAELRDSVRHARRSRSSRSTR